LRSGPLQARAIILRTFCAPSATHNSMATHLELRSLLSACVHLSRRGGQLIREVRNSGQLGAHSKQEGAHDEREVASMSPSEVLTVADGRAQDSIVSNLRTLFPGLRLVGEEGEVPRKEPLLSWEEIPPLEHDLVVPSALAKSLTLEDTCVWVDPLDGTKEFVLGNLQNVCVLIGIAVNDRPVAGVMLQPFVDPPEGLVIYGALGSGIFGQSCLVNSNSPAELVVALSKRQYDNPRIYEALQRLEPRPRLVFMNGAGYKMLHILRGEVSALLFSKGTSRWDTCAGEALVMEVGGVVTDLDGNPYKYVEGSCYDNATGVIAARSPEVHTLILQALNPDTQSDPCKRRRLC